MRKLDLEAMDFDELWLMHEELTKILSEKISAETEKASADIAELERLWKESGGDIEGPKT